MGTPARFHRRNRIVADTAARHLGANARADRTLRDGLAEIVSDGRHRSLRDARLLDGVDFCAEPDYQIVLEYEREARSRGHAELRYRSQRSS